MGIVTCSHFTRIVVLAILGMTTLSASATDMDPRAYSNIPKDLNFVIAGYANVKGNVAFAPALPIHNAKLETHSAIFAYARSLDFWGQSGKVDVILPAAWLSGQAEVDGEQRSRSANGLTDSMVRLYVNLYGAPALSMKEFTNYKQDTIIGVSLAVAAPTGQYNPEKLVNLGTNRWYIKPEIGISKAWGPLTTEFAAGMFNFTNNNQPFHGDTLKQKPIYNMQGHLIYNFGKGVWLAADANYYMGGRTTMDGSEANNMQQNWRVGGTFSFPISKQMSIKLNGSTGVYSRTGSSYDIISVAWQYRWGEGL
ncbi:MAG: transporter [Methylococcaceae bacterium]|nr:transporter [Methylococcaceae bacterium]